MSLLTVHDVHRSYRGPAGDVPVLRGVSLQVPGGGVHAIMGPSGSGKTTLLRMLAGMESPSEGYITLRGETINNVPSDRRPTCLVFQSLALFPHKSVGENIEFPLKVRKMPAAERKARALELMRMVRLPESYYSKNVMRCSGGEKQRVALARALVFEPQLVLMDEPLGALDKQLREQMQMEIKHLHERLGVTVVYVTHDQGEALTMSDRVAVFHQGQIQQIEDPRTLYEKPLNTFVANFLGENNRLPAHLLERRGESCTVKLGRGETVEALAVNVGATGSPVSLSIRPERVLLNGASASCPNRFTGRVAEFIYLGDHIRIRLEVCGVSDFFVKQPIAEFDQALRVGDVVPIGWHVEHVRALDPLQAA